ncbi:MAG TPA: hypothetical protein DEA90_00770 [Opitutae bacterium]|nr:hypothetical protein [Puniceicoccaceae bacterium]HBR92680.1 hypothetical protein [Opitutae bacterium]
MQFKQLITLAATALPLIRTAEIKDRNYPTDPPAEAAQVAQFPSPIKVSGNRMSMRGLAPG